MKRFLMRVGDWVFDHRHEVIIVFGAMAWAALTTYYILVALGLD
jgi:hypothetical protein